MTLTDFVRWLTGTPRDQREWCVRDSVTGERTGRYTQLEAIRRKRAANAEAGGDIYHVWRADAPDPGNVVPPGKGFVARVWPAIPDEYRQAPPWQR